MSRAALIFQILNIFYEFLVMINHTLEMCCTYIVYIFSKKNLLVLQNFTILSVKNKNKRFEKFDPEKKYFLELIRRGLRKDGHRTPPRMEPTNGDGAASKQSFPRIVSGPRPYPVQVLKTVVAGTQFSWKTPRI